MKATAQKLRNQSKVKSHANSFFSVAWSNFTKYDLSVCYVESGKIYLFPMCSFNRFAYKLAFFL
jgi:hypothetical protein